MMEIILNLQEKLFGMNINRKAMATCHRLFHYLIILYFPITGSSSALPFTAFIMPIIAKININSENKGESIQPITGINLNTMFPAAAVMKRISPWLA